MDEAIPEIEKHKNFYVLLRHVVGSQRYRQKRLAYFGLPLRSTQTGDDEQRFGIVVGPVVQCVDGRYRFVIFQLGTNIKRPTSDLRLKLSKVSPHSAVKALNFLGLRLPLHENDDGPGHNRVMLPTNPGQDHRCEG